MFLTHMPEDDFGFSLIEYMIMVGGRGRTFRMKEPWPRMGRKYNQAPSECLALYNGPHTAEDFTTP